MKRIQKLLRKLFGVREMTPEMAEVEREYRYHVARLWEREKVAD